MPYLVKPIFPLFNVIRHIFSHNDNYYCEIWQLKNLKK